MSKRPSPRITLAEAMWAGLQILDKHTGGYDGTIIGNSNMRRTMDALVDSGSATVEMIPELPHGRRYHISDAGREAYRRRLKRSADAR